MSELLRIEFGANGRKLDGWLCTDIDEADIRQPLKFGDASASQLYASHVVEHVTSGESMRFFKECFRVLVPGGTLRIVVPEIARYMGREHIQDLCEGHGHFQTFCFDNLQAMLFGAGFDLEKIKETGRKEIDVHYKTIGDAKDLVESLHVEAIK